MLRWRIIDARGAPEVPEVSLEEGEVVRIELGVGDAPGAAGHGRGRLIGHR